MKGSRGKIVLESAFWYNEEDHIQIRSDGFSHTDDDLRTLSKQSMKLEAEAGLAGGRGTYVENIFRRLLPPVRFVLIPSHLVT